MHGKCKCFVMHILPVSCVHLVAVLNTALCMTCSLLMLVEDARRDHIEEGTNGRSLPDGGVVVVRLSVCSISV